VIEPDALTGQQQAKPAITEPPGAERQITQPSAQLFVASPLGRIAKGLRVQSDEPTGSPLRVIRLPEAQVTARLRKPGVRSFSEHLLERRCIRHRLRQELLQPPVLGESINPPRTDESIEELKELLIKGRSALLYISHGSDRELLKIRYLQLSPSIKLKERKADHVSSPSVMRRRSNELLAHRIFRVRRAGFSG
jgi:hypothetical protein